MSFFFCGVFGVFFFFRCAMKGLSSYAGVMESLMNSGEEQQHSPLATSRPKKEEPSKNQKPKGVGGFVLVHAGKKG